MSIVDNHGSGTLIAEINERFRKPLLAFFGRRSHTHDAEDLTQEVLLRMVRHPHVKTIESVSSYIFQVAANLLRDSARRAITQRHSLHLDIADVLESARLPPALVVDIEPERVLMAKEQVAKVAAALEELPERTRDIFILYRLEGMRQRDIALFIGISVSAVEKHLMKAIEYLAKQVARP